MTSLYVQMIYNFRFRFESKKMQYDQHRSHFKFYERRSVMMMC